MIRCLDIPVDLAASLIEVYSLDPPSYMIMIDTPFTSSSTEMTKIFMGSLPSSSSSSSYIPNRGSNSQRSYTPTTKTPRVQIDVAKAS